MIQPVRRVVCASLPGVFNWSVGQYSEVNGLVGGAGICPPAVLTHPLTPVGRWVGGTFTEFTEATNAKH